MTWRTHLTKFYRSRSFAICVLCLVLMYILFALHIWKPSSTKQSLGSSVVTGKAYSSKAYKLGQSTGGKSTRTKVIILTYARSGSSFLGELFNQNPNAFYYFEPLSEIYSYLYGIPFGMPSQETYKFRNGSVRYPPSYEANVINHQLADLFSCDFDRLPVEALQDRFTMYFGKQNQFEDYKKCLGYRMPSHANKMSRKFKTVSQAKNSVPGRKLLAYSRELAGKEQMTKVDGFVNHTYQNLLGQRHGGKSNQVHSKIERKANVSSHKGYIPTFECKYFLKNYCGKYFDGSREFDCFQNIYGVHYPGRMLNLTSDDQRTLVQLRNENNFGVLKGVNNSSKRHILQHNLCVDKSRTASAKCIPALKCRCLNTSVIAAKVIRLRMEGMEEILQADPNLKIIHYFRDPRGMENSRSIGMKSKKKGMIADAKMTCSKMMRDIRIRKDLEKKYPQNFMVLMYENLAKYPLGMAKLVYNFLGHDMPQEVGEWLLVNTNSKNPNLDKNNLGTTRSNSSATASRWMELIDEDTKSELTLICKDVLTELGLH